MQYLLNRNSEKSCFSFLELKFDISWLYVWVLMRKIYKRNKESCSWNHRISWRWPNFCRNLQMIKKCVLNTVIAHTICVLLLFVVPFHIRYPYMDLACSFENRDILYRNEFQLLSVFILLREKQRCWLIPCHAWELSICFCFSCLP